METFSVVVITYNQEDFILETLNSVYNQNYDDIELVISDDGSTDRTPEKIVSWLDKNSRRFSNAILVRNNENQGVVRNLFRGIRETNSEYIKTIAGDDVFATDALSKAYSILDEHKDCLVFSGDHVEFRYSEKEREYEIIGKGQTVSEKQFFSMNSKDQFRRLCNHSPIVAPSVFFRKSFFSTVSLDNYNFRIIEDRPLWLLTTLKGIRIPYYKGPQVFRRIHNKSLSRAYSTSSTIEKNSRRYFFADQRRYIEEIIRPNDHLLGRSEKKYLDLLIKRLVEIENNNYRIQKTHFTKKIREYMNAPYLFLDKLTRIYTKLVCSINGYKQYAQELAEALKEPEERAYCSWS